MHNPDQKTEVLEILTANGGDIAQTHLQTGVPERTLYSWRRELWRKWRQQLPPPISPKPLPEFENKVQAFTFLREKILAKLLNIANNESDTAIFATPTQQAALLSQLLDRLMKLDAYIKPYEPQEEITYELADSEGEEPGGANNEGIELVFQDGDMVQGPFTPLQLKSSLNAFGVPPQIMIYYHRPGDNRLEWSGLLTLFPSFLPDEEQVI